MTEPKRPTTRNRARPAARQGGASRSVATPVQTVADAPLSAIELAPATPPLAQLIDEALSTPITAPELETVADRETAETAEPVETDSAPDEDAAPSEPMPAPVVAELVPEFHVQPHTVAAFSLAPAFTRGLFDMATTFDAAVTNPAVASDKVKAIFTGLNDRAKTAMEKLPKVGEELSELTKGNVEALVESGKVVAKGAESLTQEAVEFGKKNFESATALFKSMAAVKNPTELFQLQSEFAKSQFDSMVAEASKLTEAWVKLAGEAVQPLQNRYALAAEKIKSATAA